MATGARDMNMPVLIALFAVSTILVYVIIVATQAWFQWEYNREWRLKVVSQPVEQLHVHNLKARQVADLDKGAVPLAQAIDQTVQMYANR